MKVIDGNFGSSDDDQDDPTLAEKLMMAADECIGLESAIKGSFVMILEDEEGLAKVATDLDAANMLYLMEFIKTSVLMSTVEQGAIH
jgi:hypothetical protein